MNILFDKRKEIYKIEDHLMKRSDVETLMGIKLEELFGRNWMIVDTSVNSYRNSVRKRVSTNPNEFITSASEPIPLSKIQKDRLDRIVNSIQLESLIEFKKERRSSHIKKARGLLDLIGKRLSLEKDSNKKIVFEERFGSNGITCFLDNFCWEVTKDFGFSPSTSTQIIKNHRFSPIRTRVIKVIPNTLYRLVLNAKTLNSHDVYARVILKDGSTFETESINSSGDYNKVFVDFNTGDNSSLDIIVGSETKINNHRFTIKEVYLLSEDNPIELDDLVHFVDIISKSNYIASDVLTPDSVIKQEFCCAIADVFILEQNLFLDNIPLKCEKIALKSGV